MVKSRQLFLICLVYSGHVALGAVIKPSLSHDITSQAVSITSIISWSSESLNNIRNQHSLSIGSTNPSSLGVYSHLSEAYDYEEKIRNPTAIEIIDASMDNNDLLYLQPYYEEYSVPSTALLEKRSPYNDDDNDDDDDDDDDDDGDDGDDDDDDDDNSQGDEPYHEGENMNGDWWKYDKSKGWKHRRKANKKVILLNNDAATAVNNQYITTTVTALPAITPVCLPGKPLPPVDRLVTISIPNETVTVRIPGEIRTLPRETRIIQRPGATFTRFFPTTIVGKDIILPAITNIVTQLETTRLVQEPVFAQISTITLDPLTVFGDNNVLAAATITQFGATFIPPALTETMQGFTITADGQVTTLYPDPVTLVHEEVVTMTNDAETIISTLKVDVTHYLLRQTVLATVFATATELLTVGITSHNNQLTTLYGHTSTATENVVVTVVRPRSTTVTPAAMITDAPVEP